MKLLPFLALLSGCIIYDHTGKFGEDEPGNPGDSDTASTGNDTQSLDDTGGTDTTDTGVPGEVSFKLDPSVGLIGTTFIASLTASNFDLATVSNQQFYGEVQTVAAQNRGNEILFTLSIPGSAHPGSADLLLEVNDGTAKFLPAILSISDGSDPSTDTGTDTDTSTETDTGNPCN